MTTAADWNHVPTPAELAADYALTASIDPGFAHRDREWYEARTEGDLRALKTQAWLCSNRDSYQKARAYLAIMGAAID